MDLFRSAEGDPMYNSIQLLAPVELLKYSSPDSSEVSLHV